MQQSLKIKIAIARNRLSLNCYTACQLVWVYAIDRQRAAVAAIDKGSTVLSFCNRELINTVQTTKVYRVLFRIEVGDSIIANIIKILNKGIATFATE